MPSISYRNNSSGTLVAVWPGSTIQTDQGPRKQGQKYLGKVIDKDRLIFWKRDEGYFHFNPDDQSITALEAKDVPNAEQNPDGARKERHVLVDFGDSYFLKTLIDSIGYNEVLDSLKYVNRDTLCALLFYYILEGKANVNADRWYRQNYASYLFPKANIYSQRISDMLAKLGDDSQRRDFLLAHIKYLLNSTDQEVSILIDSTGMPNKCDLPVTRVSNHEGDINIEFRMIALVQRSTGLPIFYEIIPGNIVDVSTTQRIIELAKQYHCDVSYAIGDAGYCCPSTMEKLVLSGIDFMTRLNPTYDLYKQILDEHAAELKDDTNAIRYRDRILYIVKVETKIAVDQETGKDVTGFVYLCRDRDSSSFKYTRLMKTKSARKMTCDQILEISEQLGVFAIVTTRDLPVEEVLPEYYVRQDIEQYFDFGKNYAKFLPVRQHNMETLKGHMLIAFIATFLVIVIKNRLGMVDSRYVEVSPALAKALDEPSEDAMTDKSGKSFLEQIPVGQVFRESPSSLFLELRGQKAEVFDEVILPEIPIRQARDFYDAFRIASPFKINRKDNALTYVFKEGEKNKLTRKYAFARKAYLSDDEIEKKRKANELIRVRKAAEKAGLRIAEDDASGKSVASFDTNSSDPLTVPEAGVSGEKPTDVITDGNGAIPAPDKGKQDATSVPRTADSSDGITKKRGRGRPPGSKNKKTLEREAAEAAAGIVHVKRKPGRPPGSKNKKTLEREAREADLSGTKRDGA